VVVGNNVAIGDITTRNQTPAAMECILALPKELCKYVVRIVLRSALPVRSFYMHYGLIEDSAANSKLAGRRSRATIVNIIYRSCITAPVAK